jgi:hypothetical protein
MNSTKTPRGSSNNVFVEVVEVLRNGQFLDLPHVLVAAFFIFTVRAKTTYLPVLIPAFLFGTYQEWTLHKQDGISTIKYSLLSILVCWLGTFAYRLTKQRMIMHKLVRPLPHF